mmetsp:Transcript_7179/g.13086  ORF Transcript_7179/g.13086 Transcript_7179/m.13086 type:complete len:296 (-) Transcript_7179:252-1139(-)
MTWHNSQKPKTPIRTSERHAISTARYCSNLSTARTAEKSPRCKVVRAWLGRPSSGSPPNNARAAASGVSNPSSGFADGEEMPAASPPHSIPFFSAGMAVLSCSSARCIFAACSTSCTRIRSISWRRPILSARRLALCLLSVSVASSAAFAAASFLPTSAVAASSAAFTAALAEASDLCALIISSLLLSRKALSSASKTLSGLPATSVAAALTSLLVASMGTSPGKSSTRTSDGASAAADSPPTHAAVCSLPTVESTSDGCSVEFARSASSFRMLSSAWRASFSVMSASTRAWKDV